MKVLKPMNIIAIGAGLTIFGGVVTAIGSYLQNKSSSAKSDSIKLTGESTLANTTQLRTQNTELKEKVIFLESSANDQIKMIQKLTMQNADLSNQLSQSVVDSHGNITGGESFCIITISPQKDSSTALLGYHQHGKYPLYQIRGTIDQLTGKEGLRDSMVDNWIDSHPGEDPPLRFFDLYRHSFEIGDITVDGNGATGPFAFDLSQDYKAFRVVTLGKNGWFQQELRLVRVNGVWLQGIRVKRPNTDKYIYEKYPEGFPEAKKWK